MWFTLMKEIEQHLRLLGNHRIDCVIVGGVAAQIALLLRVPDFDRYDLSAVRGLIVGRTLLYPGDDDVSSAVATAVSMVR